LEQSLLPELYRFCIQYFVTYSTVEHG